MGPQTYAQVRKLVEEKKIPVGQAFEEVAKATGRTKGTVAVTYYRIAQREGGRRKRGPGRQSSAGRPDRRGGSAGHSPRAKAVLGRVAAIIRELESVIAEQAREIAELRQESGLAARIRKALRG